MKAYIKKYLALTADKKWLLTESVLFVFSAKVLLVFLPVKSVLRVSLDSKNRLAEPYSDLLKEIRQALNYADRVTFWKNRCLVQSIAGRWMLQRRGIESSIYFGVRHDSNKKLVAHAWLKAGNIEVVEKGSDYLELSAF